MKQRNLSRSTLYKNIFLFVCITAIFTLAVFGSQLLSTNATALTIIDSLGYVGVFVAALIAGLNVFVPIPAATFTPLFVAAGLTIPQVILALALGTVVADWVSYFIGHMGRQVIATSYPRVLYYTQKITTQPPSVIILFVGLYAAVIPLPNEAILIPLALAGVSWRLLVVPLLVGALVIQTLLVTGVSWLQLLS
jgi:membrane protein YqaA with SNARE-associated domain